MSTSILDLGITIVFGIGYLIAFAKIFERYIDSIAKPKNNALRIIYFGSITAAGINLVHISGISTQSLTFFVDSGELIKGVMFASAFYVGMWLFSYLFVRLSFIIMAAITPENESAELARNNTEIAILHVVILILLSFVISPAVVQFASEFIPYPELPFN